jgi:hypothetical protein
MTTKASMKVERFFASRTGVCVYVTLEQQTFRVRFASIDAHGVVVDGGGEGAEDARVIARAALQQRAASLAPLFEKVSRGST